MKILFISNLFPPFFIGGYELACKDIQRCLRRRGFDTFVLTSTYGIQSGCRTGKVFRALEHSLGHYPKSSKPFNWYARITGYLFSPRNLLISLREISHLKPDIIYSWCMEHISVSPLYAAQFKQVKTAFYIFDLWYVHLKERCTESLSSRKRMVKKVSLIPGFREINFELVAFGSEFLRKTYEKNGIKPSYGRVLYHGLDIEKWKPMLNRTGPHATWRILYVGQLAPHKGVHNIVRALSRLRERGVGPCTFVLVGKGTRLYREWLEEEGKRSGVEMVFRKEMKREELPDVYSQQDLLIFASVWDEPFGLVILEAMACGLPVVVAETGGAVEIVEGAPVRNTFPRDDPEALAERVEEIMEDAKAWQSLRAWGIERVRSRFSLERTVDETERFLREAIR